MLAATATLRASVSTGHSVGTLTSAVAGAVATLSATVETTHLDSFQAPSTATRLRLQLGGRWVPDEDILGTVTIRRSIDSHRTTASVTLGGRSYQFLSTLRTWTLTPAEVWRHQRSADGTEITLLELRGSVLPGTTQGDGCDPRATITIDNAAHLADLSVCHEVAPFSGASRGAVAASVAESASIFSTRIPSGSRFDKPVFTDSAPVMDFLREFGAPQAWSWRLADDGQGGQALEAYVARIKPAPLQPDQVWGRSAIESVEVAAPSDVPHCVIARGLGAVSVDEDGLRTELTTTEIRAPYSPVPAVARQAGDGSQVSVTLVSLPADRVVRRLEVEERYRGDILVSSETREFAWFNPRAARLETRAGGGGPVDGYFWRAGSYILADGSYRLWAVERFVQVSARRLEQIHDGDGNLVATHTEEDGWHSLTMGVERVSGGQIVGALIGDDDESFAPPLERYGRRVRHEVSFIYDRTVGAVTSELTNTYGFYSPRAAVDVGTHFLRYSGEARVDAVDRWMLTGSQRVDRVLTSDGLEGGRVTLSEGFLVPSRIGGLHDFGGGISSDKEKEVFRLISSENVQLNRRPDGTVEQITFPGGDRPPTVEVMDGNLPLPRYEISPWTRLRQEPIELFFEDETLRRLFGSRELTLTNDYLTSAAEAEAWARHELRRELSLRVTVTRPYVPVPPGATVLIQSPDDGFSHRALLVDVESTDDVATGESTGRYLLEVPMFEGVR